MDLEREFFREVISDSEKMENEGIYGYCSMPHVSCDGDLKSVPATRLLHLLEKEDALNYNHSVRVAEMCREFGAFLKLPKNDLNELCYFALLHDIGKIMIPPQIIQKKDALTNREWEEIKRHAILGSCMAARMSCPTNISNDILFHHEHWDGTGYPLNLKREEIPYLCRILAVVDAFDAMTNDRPYRKALSGNKGIEELTNNAGTQFEPYIVENFLRFLFSSIRSSEE